MGRGGGQWAGGAARAHPGDPQRSQVERGTRRTPPEQGREGQGRPRSSGARLTRPPPPAPSQGEQQGHGCMTGTPGHWTPSRAVRGGKAGPAGEALGQESPVPCCKPGGRPGSGSCYSPPPRSPHEGRALPGTSRTSRTQSLRGGEVGAAVTAGSHPAPPGTALAHDVPPPTLLAPRAGPARRAAAAVAVDLVHTRGPVGAG